MAPDASRKAYQGRRRRKYDTVEIVRARAFYGACGESARSHADTAVTLPPQQEWDHFDQHVQRAARWLELGVTIKEEASCGTP